MPVTIIASEAGPVLSILGEELRPLTPDTPRLSVQVFDSAAPGEAPGAIQIVASRSRRIAGVWAAGRAVAASWSMTWR